MVEELSASSSDERALMNLSRIDDHRLFVQIYSAPQGGLPAEYVELLGDYAGGFPYTLFGVLVNKAFFSAACEFLERVRLNPSDSTALFFGEMPSPEAPWATLAFWTAMKAGRLDVVERFFNVVHPTMSLSDLSHQLSDVPLHRILPGLPGPSELCLARWLNSESGPLLGTSSSPEDLPAITVDMVRLLSPTALATLVKRGHIEELLDDPRVYLRVFDEDQALTALITTHPCSLITVHDGGSLLFFPRPTYDQLQPSLAPEKLGGVFGLFTRDIIGRDQFRQFLNSLCPLPPDSACYLGTGTEQITLTTVLVHLCANKIYDELRGFLRLNLAVLVQYDLAIHSEPLARFVWIFKHVLHLMAVAGRDLERVFEGHLGFPEQYCLVDMDGILERIEFLAPVESQLLRGARKRK